MIEEDDDIQDYKRPWDALTKKQMAALYRASRETLEDDDIQDYVKPWVGLTKEELEQLCYEWRIIYGAHVEEFVLDITNKLRSKNT